MILTNSTIRSLLIVILSASLTACQMRSVDKSQAEQTPQATEQTPQATALLAFAQCMRHNGVPRFPDPTVDGISLHNTGIDPSAPEFKAAQKACDALLPQSSLRVGANSPWEKVVAGKDYECADGSEFAFFDRKANPAKVVFFLDGGGICFDSTSCANAMTPGTGERPGLDYESNVAGKNPAQLRGMFDFTRPDNPFRDYSFVYVPQCTADSHLGNATREYSPGMTVKHKGFVNGTAAVRYLAEHYPDAVQVVVVGKTAGSVAAPLYGGLIADLRPGAQVIVFGAQSGAFPDSPDLNSEILDKQWGAFDNKPAWDVNNGLTAREWGPTRFWIQAGRHVPGIVLARFDYAFDAHAVEALAHLSARGGSSNTLAVIDANEQAIEGAGLVLHSYTAPGNGHGILDLEKFYVLEVSGVKLVDWVAALIGGKPLNDVHCDKCAAE